MTCPRSSLSTTETRAGSLSKICNQEARIKKKKDALKHIPNQISTPTGSEAQENNTLQFHS